jgi:2-amino-4-hydroxy-6-hydroxymethyldihydropteridine diphosphokinase
VPGELVTVYVALGGNLGDVLGAFRGALAELERGGLAVQAVSSAFRTDALLPPGATGPAPDYWNAVLGGHTGLAPRSLLTLLQAVEGHFGRVRHERWASRTLDLDLLVYGDRLLAEPGLSVPHPRLSERVFVLRPFAELAPELVVPGLGVTVATLLGRLDPEAGVRERREGWRSAAKR